MSRCIVLMAAIALAMPAFAEEVKNAPAPVVKVTPKAPAAAVAPAAAPAPAAKAAPAAAAPATAPAVAKAALAVTNAPASAPTTATEAIDTAKQGFDFAKARNWFGMSACIIFLVMFGLNALKVFDKIGKRWAYIILPVLGVAAALCTRFIGGASWEGAISVFTSAPVTGLLWDFVKRGILAKEPTTAMKPTAAEPTK